VDEKILINKTNHKDKITTNDLGMILKSN